MHQRKMCEKEFHFSCWTTIWFLWRGIILPDLPRINYLHWLMFCRDTNWLSFCPNDNPKVNPFTSDTLFTIICHRAFYHHCFPVSLSLSLSLSLSATRELFNCRELDHVRTLAVFHSLLLTHEINFVHFPFPVAAHRREEGEKGEASRQSHAKAFGTHIKRACSFTNRHAALRRIIIMQRSLYAIHGVDAESPCCQIKCTMSSKILMILSLLSTFYT